MGIFKIISVLILFAVATYLYTEGLLFYVLGAAGCIYALYVVLFKWPNTRESGMSSGDIARGVDEKWDEWTDK